MKKILIVNRGEIAIRVAQAVAELGHHPVGVWTDFEPEAPHLEFCQSWLHLAGQTNSETYLNIPKILKLIQDHQIDAVHPGYGFLSENAKFVQALEDNGVIFIGPHSKAIESMGDKAVSKKIAKEAGVPTIPGSVGEVASVDEALKISKEITFPVLLKATAGGGGKGMRVCQNEDEVKNSFDAVRREALSSFGHDGVLVEKFIVNPHHIEVQILADQQGNVFHCYERECSVQRRHQKVVEEAPSPFIGQDWQLREKLCQSAVLLAQNVKYNSAGTVEFIMGEDKQFYFLEMNTRIQVEHPITEEITGVDLVKNMIRSALGEKMDVSSQDQIQIRGHAIECRICAEDPVSMLPAPGKIHRFYLPRVPGVRFDHCLMNQMAVTSDFDPMLAKLVAKGWDRSAAIEKMRYALSQLEISGLTTNILLHREILKEEVFCAGNYSTKYLEEHQPQKRVESLPVEQRDHGFMSKIFSHLNDQQRI